MFLKKPLKNQMKKYSTAVLSILLVATQINVNVAYAAPTISGVSGTEVDYDEMDGSPVLAMPTLQIASTSDFGSDSYIEFWVEDATQYDALGLKEVADEASISTINGQISVYNSVVYKGNGTTADAIGNIDSQYDGEGGEKLKITFKRTLPNANFLDGETSTFFADGNTLDGWIIDNGVFDLYGAGLNLRSRGTQYSSITSSDSVVTINGTDSTASPYSYNTDWYYPTTASAWGYESVERPSSGTTTVSIDTAAGGTGGRSLKLTIGGGVVSDNSGASDPHGSGAYGGIIEKYGSMFGPVVTSDSFSAKAGEKLSIDWKALRQSDDYEVYGYVKNIDTSAYTLVFYGRGNTQAWTTSEGIIPTDGEYQFVFINGTYDQTGGYAVGSYLWIDNIQVYGTEYSAEVAEDIAVLVEYKSTSKDPAATRNLNVKVVDEDGEGSAATASSTINIVNQFSHQPTITATAVNPAYNKGEAGVGTLFSGTDATTEETQEHFEELQLSVDGVEDADSEILVADDTDIILADGTIGVTADNSIPYNVAASGDSFIVTLSSMNLNDTQMNSFVNNLKYKNLLTELTPGTRTFTLLNVKDSGGSTGLNVNETALNIVSTVSASNVVADFAKTGRTASTIDFAWSEATGASAIKIQQSTNNGSSWTDSATSGLTTASTVATVTGISSTQAYKFRLVVTGGDKAGISNSVAVDALSSDTVLTSSVYNISSGGTANETITDVYTNTSKADFLSNLTKNQADQIINSDNISDPVVEGDTLVVTSESGTTTTYTITTNLTTQTPTVGAQPENSSNLVGDSASFSVEASTLDGGTISYQWETSTDGINWSEISGATNDSYTASGLTRADDGVLYRCIISNTKGGSTVDTTSDEVTLRVYEADEDEDGDGVPNADELAAGSDPANSSSVPSDKDGDGSLDDPTGDSDGDGISDEDEVAAGSNPDNPNSVPSDKDADGVIDDDSADSDGDGVSDADEVVAGSNPDGQVSSNCYAQYIELSDGTLSPLFSKYRTSFTVNVANEVDEIFITTTTVAFNASIIINGTGVEGGVESGGISLDVGDNTVDIEITAADGTVKTYTITVNRYRELLSNATLSSLNTSSGQLTPSFNGGVNKYLVYVGKNLSSITVTPTLADSNATVKVNGVLVNSGSASQSITLETGTNLITIRVIAEDGIAVNDYEITVKREKSQDSDEDSNTSGGSGSSSTSVSGGSSAPTNNGTTSSDVNVDVNGNERTIGVETVTDEDGETTGEIVIDSDSLGQRIDEMAQGNNGNNVIDVVSGSTGTNSLTTVLTGDAVKKMEDNSFSVAVTTGNVRYIIPAEEINIESVAKTLGVSETSLSSITVRVVISQVSESAARSIAQNAAENNYTLLTEPIEFTVIASVVDSSGKTTETTVSKFGTFVERVVEISGEADINKITTGIVYNEDGTFSHVPTYVFTSNGKVYAKINSLTNSSYSVVYNELNVPSVENHWSKVAVNDMARRLVVKNPDSFQPDSNITRGEFAEYITKALGLYRTGVAVDGQFSDVKATDDLADAITTAVYYGIISGYTDETFKPEKTITREEAMAMYSRAMKIIELEGTDADKINNYTDFASVSEWAKEDIKSVISAKVFNGTSDSTLSPKSQLTYAEAAQAIRNLLVEADLINE